VVIAQRVSDAHVYRIGVTRLIETMNDSAGLSGLGSQTMTTLKQEWGPLVLPVATITAGKGRQLNEAWDNR